MNNKKNPVVIIGAGPAGLAMAGRLKKLGMPFLLLEQNDKIASAWHNHYDRLHLHTVKQFSHLPHLPFPESYPQYVSRLDLIRYFENYCKEFDINPKLNVRVEAIKREGSQWKVLTKSAKFFKTDHVVVATGSNRVPNIPSWGGQNVFTGTMLHSSIYKNPKPFKGKKVLVVGMGNSGAEIALDLAEHNVEVSLCVRNPVSIVPRDVGGRSVQLTAKKLEKLPFGLGDWLGAQIRKIVYGDLTKFGLPISKMYPSVLVRETRKTPVIDIGTIDAIKAGKIEVVGAIEHFIANGIVFQNGGAKNYDAVILATGYRAKLGEFIENLEGLLDHYDLPKSPIAENDAFRGLYFLGFDNYKLGGILGTIYNDSELIAEFIQQEIK